ncbi:MAG: leucine-rich repeat protein [Lachnospiraceae bacterium]|nr:leucine-rich repeat protein [Lachnospiraceae bacterium]
MRKLTGLAKRMCTAALSASLILTQGLTVLATETNQKETRSDGIEITWEDTARTKGYVSKVPSSFSGSNGTWTVPDGVYKIEDEAIDGGTNSRVTKILLPESFETKEFSASGNDIHDIFDKFTALTDIDVDAKNKNFAALNGVLYSADRKTIIEYPVGRTSIDLGTAANAADNPAPTRIGKWAFSGLKLKDFSLPSSVTDYEEHALTGLEGVDRMVLPSKPAMLKSHTFENTGFKEIVIPNNIDGNSIAKNWLVTDHDVTVTIPNTITSIADDAIVLNNNAKLTVKAPKDSAAEKLVTKLNNANITFEETAAGNGASNNASTNSSGTSGGKTAQVNNQVTNMDNKNKVSAKVNGATGNDEYTLVVKDSAGNNIKKLVPLDSKTSLMAYDLSLVDKDGKEVTNFNNVEVTLPVPSNMDRSKGTIDVVTVNSRGTLETLRTSVKEDGGAVTATFVTSHFSEFAIRYVQDNASVAASTASTTSAAAASTTTTGSGTGRTNTMPRNSSGDMPRTGDAETYQIMLMTMGALFGAMMLVMLATHGAGKRNR